MRIMKKFLVKSLNNFIVNHKNIMTRKNLSPSHQPHENIRNVSDLANYANERIGNYNYKLYLFDGILKSYV